MTVAHMQRRGNHTSTIIWVDECQLTKRVANATWRKFGPVYPPRYWHNRCDCTLPGYVGPICSRNETICKVQCNALLLDTVSVAVTRKPCV